MKFGTFCSGNLRWVCEAVNIAKRNMTDDEFLSLCSECLAWIGQRIKSVRESRLP